jgi:tRNA(Ile)-lysidine synthetase-like protein
MPRINIAKTIALPPGQYVIAVSGGVDSMVLLDIVRQLPGVRLTVAHYDHGIRHDSHLDRMLVSEVANSHGLPFIYDEGNLGTGASENVARKARYNFLNTVKLQANADRIITAHHLDDVLETATHNLLRGTGRKGMASLKSVDGIVRPLLHLPKARLIAYAEAHDLKWREDSTNSDTRYRRNYIRHRILPRIKTVSPKKYNLLKQLVRRQAELNVAIDGGLGTILHVQPGIAALRRHDVIMLPHMVARELVGEWLRRNEYRDFNRKHLEKVTIALKTARPNTTLVLNKKRHIKIDKKHAYIVNM